MPAWLKPILLSVLVLLPSALLVLTMVDNHAPVPYAYFVACLVLSLAAFDFATVIFIEQYRTRLSRLTIPALLATIFVILLYVIASSLNRYFEHLGYAYFTGPVMVVMLLVYTATFREKHTLLKGYLGLNAAGLALLWAMGNADKVMMPF